MESAAAGPPLFGYLYASPLTQQAGDGRLVESLEELEELSVRAEAEEFRAMFEDQGRAVRLRSSAASRQGLRAVLGAAPDVVHFTGHGFPGGFLALEDGAGNLDKLGTADLTELLSVQGSTSSAIKLVFISACFSEDTGEVFVRAGVPHVVAVRRDLAVADKVSSEFAVAFYQALLGGLTVSGAFLHARGCVQLTPGRDDAWRARQMTKFLLLPREGVDHDVGVLPCSSSFGGVQPGPFLDESPSPPVNSCGKVTHCFVGRQVLVQRTIQGLVWSDLDEDEDAVQDQEQVHEGGGSSKGAAAPRWLTLFGQEGIGKTACAVSACDFIAMRCNCKGVFFVPMQARQERNGSRASFAAANASSRSCLRGGILALIRAHAPPGTGLAATQSEAELYAALTEFAERSPCRGRIVLLLDGCEQWIGGSEVAREALCGFVDDLLAGCQGAVTVLSTSRRPLTCSASGSGSLRAEEVAIEVGPLSSLQSAQLLVKLSRRQLSESEVMFGRSSALFNHMSRAQRLAHVAKHPVLGACGGHPLIIGQITERLATESLNNLLEQAKAAAKSLAAAGQQGVLGEGGGRQGPHLAANSSSSSSSNNNNHSMPLASAPPVAAAARSPRLPMVRGDSGRELGSFSSIPTNIDDLGPPMPTAPARQRDSASVLPVPVGGAAGGAGSPPGEWQPAAFQALRQALAGCSDGDPWSAAQPHVTAVVRSFFEDDAVISRPLSPESLQRISVVLANGRGDPRRLWKWLEATLSTLLAFHEYWNNGVVYGLISKGEVSQRLGGCPPGTFMVRISESQPGQLALAVKESSGQVRHVLVAPAASAASPTAVRVQTKQGAKLYNTFGAFIAEWPSLATLYPDVAKLDVLPAGSF